MHRRVYIVLFIAVFASTMGVGFIGPLLPLYARDLGATGVSLGMIFAGFSISRFVLTPFIGRASDRHGRKVFLAFGLAAVSGFSLLYLWASSAGQLILVRALHGASAGMVIPIAQAYIGDISPQGKESTFMGTFTVSLMEGANQSGLRDSNGRPILPVQIEALTIVVRPNLAELIAGLNGAEHVPDNQIDIDQNGEHNSADVLTVVSMLNTAR